jgi:DNA-binding helix-hairpin-helix protein with protein kinase domain
MSYETMLRDMIQRVVRTEMASLADELVAQVVAEVRKELRGREAAPKALHRSDQEVLQALLPEIVRSYGLGLVFAVRDLFRHAETDPTLQAHLIDAFGAMDARAARKAGMFFRRVVGVAASGLRLARNKAGRSGSLWSVELGLCGT